MTDAHVSPACAAPSNQPGHGAAGRPAKYLWIWVWLAVLMLVSVVLSETPVLPLAPGVVILIVLGLSTIKALLVALYYMHLKFDRRWLVIVASFPLVLIGLAVLLVLSSRLVKL